MKYFIDCTTLDELKKEYRRLALKNHPDVGGDTKIMMEINAEYEKAHDALQKAYNATAPEDMQKHETAAEYITIIEKLMRIKGISVELCGSWLWISGDTRNVKDALKAAGCKWAAKKAMWYWHPGDYRRKGHTAMPMSHIRTKYGSQLIGRGDTELATA